MFIAVGDERCQRVDVVGMLHHRDFIGLWMTQKKEKLKRKTDRNYELVVQLRKRLRHRTFKRSQCDPESVCRTLFLSPIVQRKCMQ